MSQPSATPRTPTAVADPWRAVSVPLNRSPIENPLVHRLADGDVPNDFPLLAMPNADPPTGDPPLLDRPALLDELIACNAALNNPLDEDTRRAIADDGWLVVTGQQPGIWLGPMYTLLKALTAIRLAEHLTRQWRRPVKPAFWIATEDHDIAEVNRVTVGRRTFVCQHPELSHAARPPVGLLSLEPWRERMLRFADTTLGDLPHGKAVLRMLAEADYRDYGRFFASLLLKLIGPSRMVLLDPMRLRQSAAPVMARLAERADAVHADFERGTATVRAAGYEPQVQRVSMFEFANGRRQRIDLTTDLAEAVRDDPARYSAGAALRPIVQDNMLPAAAYIGGPAELMYLWQIGPIYDAAGLSRSRLRPRCSATLIERPTLERAGRFGLDEAHLFDARRLLAAFDPRDHADADPALDAITQQAGQLTERIAGVHLTDPRPAKRAVDAVRHHAERVVHAALHERAAAAGHGKEVLRSVVDALQPAGVPQERHMSPLEAVARYGIDLPGHLERRLDIEAIDHRLLVHESDPTTKPSHATHPTEATPTE